MFRLTSDDVDGDPAGVADTGVAGVAPTVHQPRLLDQQEARRYRAFFGDLAHAAPGARVGDGLESAIYMV